jgi:hypothetical protein
VSIMKEGKKRKEKKGKEVEVIATAGNLHPCG